jgi:hypothetical protein
VSAAKFGEIKAEILIEGERTAETFKRFFDVQDSLNADCPSLQWAPPDKTIRARIYLTEEATPVGSREELRKQARSLAHALQSLDGIARRVLG